MYKLCLVQNVYLFKNLLNRYITIVIVKTTKSHSLPIALYPRSASAIGIINEAVNIPVTNTITISNISINIFFSILKTYFIFSFLKRFSNSSGAYTGIMKPFPSSYSTCIFSDF